MFPINKCGVKYTANFHNLLFGKSYVLSSDRRENGILA